METMMSHRLESLAADLDVLDRLGDGRSNMLTVGPIMPSTSHFELLHAFATYHRHHDDHSRLVIVGKRDRRFRNHFDALRFRVHELGLRDSVLFIRDASDSVLKACYLSAKVFLFVATRKVSRLPMWDALAMRVPIIAVGSRVLPEALDEVSIAWDSFDPWLVAESMHRLVSDEALHADLGERGWRRYRQHRGEHCALKKFTLALGSTS